MKTKTRMSKTWTLKDFGSAWLPKFNGDFLVQSYICDKKFRKIHAIRLSRDVNQIVEKCPISQCWRILQKLDADPDADDFQNLVSFSLFKDTYVIKFSWRSVQYFYVKLPTDKQADKQINAGHYTTSLPEVISFVILMIYE